jgi:hypothetical protein
MRVAALVASYLFAGLGGAVFTWYVNRSKPVVITYSVTTTTLNADPVKGLIPDLRMTVDDRRSLASILTL